MATKSSFFRANVGAMIINRQGKVLVFERADLKDAWQMPQGGIEAGEAPRDAVFREVGEETGIHRDKLKLLAEASEWLAYELPEQYRNSKTGLGQVQKWFLFRFCGEEQDIRPDQSEFTSARWVNATTLQQITVEFRQPIYRRLLREFDQYLSSAGYQS